MEQRLFSDTILACLQQKYPDFLPVNYSGNQAFECSLKSPSGHFSMWIATHNEEITYGFEGPDGKTDIHSHIGCYESEDLPGCVESLTRWIDSVRQNRTLIYLNDAQQWDWIEEDTLLNKEVTRGKLYHKYYWQDPFCYNKGNTY